MLVSVWVSVLGPKYSDRYWGVVDLWRWSVREVATHIYRESHWFDSGRVRTHDLLQVRALTIRIVVPNLQFIDTAMLYMTA